MIGNKQCKYCKIIFKQIEGKVFSNHVRWCTKNTTNGDKGSSSIKRSRTLIREIIKKTCKKCGNIFEVERKVSKSGKQIIPKKGEREYCTRSCANSRPNQKEFYTEEVRKKLSESTKRLWQDPNFVQKITAKNKVFTSRREREIVEHFKENYKEDEWKSGGSLRYHGESIVRDLYSDKLQVCFEYDGIWHFKDIHGQLENKKNKDSLLESWCKEKNYRIIRIDSKSNLSIKEIEFLIYNRTDPIIKIGDRYS